MTKTFKAVPLIGVSHVMRIDYTIVILLLSIINRKNRQKKTTHFHDRLTNRQLRNEYLNINMLYLMNIYTISMVFFGKQKLWLVTMLVLSYVSSM